MAASTRSGFPGGSSGGHGPTETQSARTLFGHDLHFDAAAIERARVDEPDRPITQEEVPAAPRGRAPSHSGKSRFPALARLFGRWNTQGDFESNEAYDDGLDDIPRERFLRPLAIVVATSAISFFIVVGLLKLRDQTADPPPPASVVQPVAALPPPPAPTVAPAPAPRAQPALVQPIRVHREVARQVPSPPRRALPERRRPRAPARLPIDPDSPMPLSF
jgi:hypothetical protein